MRRPACLLWSIVLGCGVRHEETPIQPSVPLACQSDDQCKVGQCLTGFGVCAQSGGALSSLLFEVTPPPSDSLYGGARFLAVQALAPNPSGDPTRDIEPGWSELNVRPQVSVSGFVAAAPDQSSCLSDGRSTLPVTLTFTPRERLYGLSVSSYELSTSLQSLGEYTFQGTLPPGHYDVYMRPDTASLSPSCVAIPQIFRDRSVGEMFRLDQTAPASLHLTLPWNPSLEGWLLDMVHPVTGEVISNVVHLSRSSVDAMGQTLSTTLYYSQAENDFIAPGEELVRLTPPPGTAAGTILLQRSGVELAAPGEGVIGNVFGFGAPVDFKSWVWGQRSDSPVPAFDNPVAASVSFAARDLDNVADGVLVSFGATALADASGQIELSLLPGQYRIRVTPPAGELPNLGLLAGFESNVTVWPNDDGSSTSQGGHVITVPPAATLVGQVVADATGKVLPGVEVRASAASAGPDDCPADGSDQASSCERLRTSVLQKALAQDPFVPRTRSALTENNGRFQIDGLDCGQCQPGAGARFDVSVRPPPEMRLPWLVRPGNSIDSVQAIQSQLRVQTPVAYPMKLTYGDPAGDGKSIGLPGALIRAFALLDDQSKLVTDIQSLVPCAALTNPEGSHCVQSLLQVAELRSGNDGDFLLLLPPEIQ